MTTLALLLGLGLTQTSSFTNNVFMNNINVQRGASGRARPLQSASKQSPFALYNHHSSHSSSSGRTSTSTSTSVHHAPEFTAPPPRNPIVVSSKAEALSHSETTMKLTPSYDLFQILPEEEGGQRSHSALLYEYKHNVMEVRLSSDTHSD